MAKHEVLLSGKTLEGYNLEKVSADVATTFEIALDKVKGLLDGKTKVIKKNMSEQAAKELKDKLNAVGAQAAMREMKAPKPSSGLQLVDDDPKPTETASEEKESSLFSCPKCGVVQERSESCTSCGIIIEKYLAIQKAREENGESAKPGISRKPTTQSNPNSKERSSIPLYAIGAGVAGAALWAMIAYSMGYELGLLAWAIGGAVGFAFTLSSPHGGNTAGVLAAVIAALAILAGKYATIQMFIDDEIGIDSSFREELMVELQNDEMIWSYMADSVAKEYEESGLPVEWPDWSGPEIAYAEEDYPTDIWKEAKERWENMSINDRVNYRQAVIAEVETNLAEVSGQIASYGLVDSFGLLDILFFFLGMGTAYRIAEQGKN